MPCKRCGKQYVSGLCSDCAFMESRDGDAKERITGSASTDGGQSLAAKLENTASSHANDALAAMDARDTETAEYHARQFAQAIVGLNRLPTTEANR